MRKAIFTAVAGCVMAISALGQQIIVQVAPPRPVVEARIASPGPGYVYQRGYHRWDGHAHVWMPGVWVMPPRPHAHWVDHRWEHRGHNYIFVEGHWR
jgi:hypothetical protein